MRDATAELLRWAASLPNWQRDALRRLALGGTLSTGDLQALRFIVWNEHGLAGPPAPAVVPLEARHLRDFDGGGAELQLLELNSITHAMQLKPTERMSFAPAGLTLVYGDNGSGKSGYARIIKRAARARGAERVRPNVFDPNFNNLPPATAVFKVRVTKNRKTTDHELNWQENDEDSGLDELAHVQVFDRRCAAIYVNDKHQVAFAPANLDILTGLVDACTNLDNELDAERAKTQDRIASLIDSIPAAGAARAFASSISPDTTTAAIDSAAAWDPHRDEPRLVEIAKVLGEAQRELALAQARLRRCNALYERTRSIRQTLSAEYEQLDTEVTGIRTAAEKLASEAFAHTPLKTAGGDAWRILWGAAREYSTSAAYPGQPFPVVDGGDPRCVMCEQPLSDGARQRLRRFENFVTDTISQKLAAAKKSLAGAVRQLRDTDVEIAADLALVEELKDDNSALAGEVTKFFSAAASRKQSLLAALDKHSFDNLAAAPDDISPAVQAYAKTVSERIDQVNKALDPTKRRELTEERDGLLTRRTLHGARPALDELLGSQKRLQCIRDARGACRTTAITKKRSELEKALLLEKLDQNMRDELSRLGLERIVRLDFSGEKGTTQQWIRFENAMYDGLDDVLSEGEHRAVALACFLAESSNLPDATPVIVDDPVSSLDHIRRRHVARRLMELAKSRQTIVFTHDLVFYAELVALAAESQVAVMYRALRRTAGAVGEIDPSGEPWPMKNAKNRLHLLESERLPVLRKLFASNDASYRDRSREMGEQLRETWERIVEEEVLGDVVIRHRPSVETQKLRAVEVDDQTYKDIYWGMTRTSAWAHDEARAKGDPPPTPDELQQEIKRMRDFLAAGAKRRDQTEKRRKALLQPPAAAAST